MPALQSRNCPKHTLGSKRPICWSLYNTSASFATSLVKTKTLRFPPMEEGSKMSVNSHDEEGNSPAHTGFTCKLLWMMDAPFLFLQSKRYLNQALCSKAKAFAETGDSYLSSLLPYQGLHLKEVIIYHSRKESSKGDQAHIYNSLAEKSKRWWLSHCWKRWE